MKNLSMRPRLFRRVLCALIFMLCLGLGLTERPQAGAATVGGEGAGLKGLKSPLPFALYRLGSGDGPTMLVVGGIQGDEPGGFSAASLLVTHYFIHTGNVWAVPNLNFPSILSNSRGLHGDMNRKFAQLDPADPEYASVRSLQELILHPKVNLVLNLHDGSGYYRPRRESDLLGPQRWGQCIVIDQEELDGDYQNKGTGYAYPHLAGLAGEVARGVNRRLLKDVHRYHIKNTRTRGFDKEMEKSLSYFAVRNGKAAFGLEASKELSVYERAYYHLCLLEGFMREAGIGFSRDFTLSPAGVSRALNSNLAIGIFGGRSVFNLDGARRSIPGFVPVEKGKANLGIVADNPLLTVVPGKEWWQVYYGSRVMTSFKPAPLEFDRSIHGVDMLVDGRPQQVGIGHLIEVEKDFLVRGREGYRVNAIGAREEVDGSEHDVVLRRADFDGAFSMDEAGRIFRVEIYRDEAYCGMILIKFTGGKGAAARPTPAPVAKPEAARPVEKDGTERAAQPRQSAGAAPARKAESAQEQARPEPPAEAARAEETGRAVEKARPDETARPDEVARPSETLHQDETTPPSETVAPTLAPDEAAQPVEESGPGQTDEANAAREGAAEPAPAPGPAPEARQAPEQSAAEPEEPAAAGTQPDSASTDEAGQAEAAQANGGAPTAPAPPAEAPESSGVSGEEDGARPNPHSGNVE